MEPQRVGERVVLSFDGKRRGGLGARWRGGSRRGGRGVVRAVASRRSDALWIGVSSHKDGGVCCVRKRRKVEVGASKNSKD